MFKDEELDDKELKSKLTVYNEIDIEMDRTAIIKQHLDGLKKTLEKGRKEMMEEEIRELFEEGFESEVDLHIAADLLLAEVSKEHKKMTRKRLIKLSLSRKFIEPCCQKMKKFLREEKNKVKDMNYQIDLFAKVTGLSKEQIIEALRKK